ncbi:MAG: excinuclease ABC subunit UvrA [Elusimicrobiota bacterium]
MNKTISIRGAREHNLKNISVDLPRDKFIVVTGVSGSGKSSLAFDTVYAEGRRRYVESLSAYARQFLGDLKKPRVDTITGIPPAVAIEQKGPGYNPRSTVGTLTEIYDYLRLLFARAGIPHCYSCGRKIQASSESEIVRQAADSAAGESIKILAPVVRGKKGKYRQLLNRLAAEGFISVKIDGKIYSLEEDISLDGRKKHDISILVDELDATGSSSNMERITDSVEIALKKAEGNVEIEYGDGRKEMFSTHYACAFCGISAGTFEPRNFSFNSPYGACPSCSGLGVRVKVDPELAVPDKSLSINQGALKPWADPVTTRRQRWKGAARRYKKQMLQKIASELGFSLDTPFEELNDDIKNIILYGSSRSFRFTLSRGGRTYVKEARFEGVAEELERRHLQTESSYVREKIQSLYMREMECPDCRGKRLNKKSLAVLIKGKNISEMTSIPVKKLLNLFEKMKLDKDRAEMAGKIITEIRSRLGFLIDVGVDYVSLERKANTLSSGEAERIRLATQIGSSLVGVVYILDEPTVGLHARDTKRLLNSLSDLKKIGNTLIVVEHDSMTIDAADYVVDLGPGAGVGGGKLVYAGEKSSFRRSQSLTAKYYSGRKKVPLPSKRRRPNKGSVKVKGCRQFNLKNVDADFKLKLFNCVTGVSGSGKSTLVEEILYKGLKKRIFSYADTDPGEHDSIMGAEKIQKIINIDQTPIGRTPRSNPATYTKVFTPLRELFESLPLSRERGYSKGRFSFNVSEGTCGKCSGQGWIKKEMHFLPDIYVKCSACEGRKFTDSTLEVKYRGKNIHDVLEMTVSEALGFFSKIPSVKRILKTLNEVGLGYIKLGQPSTTLSGGEAQRIKLARELAKKSSGDTLYILDEPTTGLHPEDIRALLNVLHRLTDRGNTVVVIEHNMDVIKNADWIIDMGPEGGDGGGEVVACGSPLKLLKCKESHTGRFLKEYIENEK